MKKENVSPNHGGCWFCNMVDDAHDWLFSFEFDCFLHKSCLLAQLSNCPEDDEAQIMRKELLV